MQIEASKTVPLEVREDLRHTKRGILSMARSDDPHSGGSSFSILLGPAPHLDMNYAIFGRVTSCFEFSHDYMLSSAPSCWACAATGGELRHLQASQQLCNHICLYPRADSVF